MEFCKTCIHWQKPSGRDDLNAVYICKPVDPDTFEPMERGFEVRLCKHPSQTFAEAPIEDNGFGIADGSNYFACLATSENFGCVRYEGPKCKLCEKLAVMTIYTIKNNSKMDRFVTASDSESEHYCKEHDPQQRKAE
jgi:hypothetical protein